MKNDFDFIKDKFDQSGVNAPEDMDEKFMLDRLGEETQNAENPKIVEFKKVKPFRKYSLVAACALLLTVAVTATAVFRMSRTPASSAGSVISGDGSSTVYRFSDRDEILALIDRIKPSEKDRYTYYADRGEYLNYDGIIAEKSSLSDTASSTGSSHGETYIQVEGVDEADVVKTDGKYIYVARDDDLVIYRAEGKKSKIVAKIKPEQNENAWEEVRELYVSKNRLTVIYGNWRYSYAATDDEAVDDESYIGSSSETRAEVYDCSDPENLIKLNSFTQSGSYSSSRMIGDKLYIVSNKNSAEAYKSPLPYVCCGDDVRAEIPANDVYCVEEPSNSNFVVVSEFDIADTSAQPITKSVLGCSNDIYCSTENLYITGYTGRYYGGLYLLDGAYVDYSEKTSAENTQKTQIIKFSLKNGVELVSSAKVKGYIDNQYSLDESGDKLRIATTSTSESGKDENNLYVLDSGLKTLGSVTGFAKDESIKAVRYVGDTAYVITYEQTDPLFVIDLSNAQNPTILGSVKISGFSSMLVPIDENTVLGIGFHTQEEDWNDEMEIEEGLKLALFDVSDKANPKVLDSEIFKNYYSEVQYNPKALLRNTERGNFSIPYSRWSEDDEECGVITFSVKDGKISVDQQDKTELEIDRCTYVNNMIYMVSTYHDGIDCVEYK